MMNEKLLKDLWHKTVMDPNNKDGDDHRIRFAELIVRECAKVAMDNDPSDTGVASDAIKKHFGVE